MRRGPRAAEREVGSGAAVVDDRRLEPEVHRGPDGRIDAHARHHSGDHELIDAARAELVCESRAHKAVGLRLLEYELALGGRDEGMDLDAVGARTHERRIRRVPHVFQVHDRLPRRPERREHSPRRGSGGLGFHEGIRATGEVVALDVDDQESAGHAT